VKVKETNNLKDIPFADFFFVVTEIEAEFQKDKLKSKECVVKVFLEIPFTKSTWMASAIESNTRSELIEVYDMWCTSASQHLEKLYPTITKTNVGQEVIQSNESNSTSALQVYNSHVDAQSSALIKFWNLRSIPNMFISLYALFIVLFGKYFVHLIMRRLSFH
jgi:hypothetical protein